MKKLSNKLLGFTLVEMTVVLVIIGLLLAGLLVPLREGIKQERRVETEDELKNIEEALYGFAVTNGRLPCPDCRAGVGFCPGAGNTLNDGVEDLIGSDCAVDPVAAGGNNILEGNIPWATIGVEQFDAWESWYTYAVMDYVADIVPNGTFGINGANCTGFGENLTTIDICAVGNIQIQDAGAACPPPVPNTVAQNVFAVIISHGENITRTVNPGTGLIDPLPVFLCSETENNNQDGIFVSTNFINPGSPVAPGGAVAAGISARGLDDQLIWISPQILKNKLVQAGKLP